MLRDGARQNDLENKKKIEKSEGIWGLWGS